MATHSVTRALPRALRRTTWPHLHVATKAIATAAALEDADSAPFIPPEPPQSPTSQSGRYRAIRDAKPFSEFLTDTFNRQHDYLRISLTERCNLRCLYCMPEEGIELSPKKNILTTPEIFYLSALFVNQGVTKIRLTGGEPTVRKDIIPLMQQLGTLRRNGLKEIALTTNGISLHRKLDDMVEAGLTGVNISLDTLDPHQFVLLTRRQGFEAVMKSIKRVQEMNKLGAGIKLKINCVAMRGLNDHQILPFVEMTRKQDVEVRFIEYMPFGGNKWSQKKMLPYDEMLDMIRTEYPDIRRLRGAKNDTSKTWQVPGFVGKVGFITSMTHNFCGSCNRLRVTSDGNLKVCLHGNTEVSLRDLLRKDHHGEPMDEAAFDAIRQIELDRPRTGTDGMSLGQQQGWISKERELLEVIGAAVKRKKAAHAGMGELENMQNRPMILIGESNRCSGSTRKTRSYPKDMPMYHLRLPWSQVPLHLLQSGAGTVRIRQFSTHGQSPEERNDDSSGIEALPKNSNAASTVSSFGFQSLSGLLQQTPPPRYSRSPESGFNSGEELLGKQESQYKNQSERQHPESKAAASSPAVAPQPGDGRNAEARQGQLESNTPGSPMRRRPLRAGMTMDRLSSGTPKSGVVRKAHRALVAPHPKARMAGQRNSRSRRPNPFQHEENASGHEVNELTRSTQADLATSTDKSQPWGISGTTIPRKNKATFTARDVNHILDKGNIERTGHLVESEQDSLRADSSDASVRLSHVKTSGEAHMVDVGGKEQTNRVAIACCGVRFSNTVPFKQIRLNNNKKGDVLGTARIAGIMAAKRTSELIPLCHPLSISKVDVQIEVIPPGRISEFARQNDHGCVTICAQVNCLGNTGVEMEAMTAASIAALTVYDMCKAVDRGIAVTRTQVVYKSGGKSGLHLKTKWARRMGLAFFMERDLGMPVSMQKRLWPQSKAQQEQSLNVVETELNSNDDLP